MKIIQISDEDFKFLEDLQHELNTQDNDGSADPLYWGVMETRMVYVPDGCGEASIYMGDGVKMTLEEAVKYVEDNIQNDAELQEKWKDIDKDWMDDVVDFIHDEMGEYECRVIWEDKESVISRDTGAFLTKRACQEYIDRYGYNHTKPRTYAMTAFRNFELERLLKVLKTIDLQDLQCVDVSSTNDEFKGICNKEEKIDL